MKADVESSRLAPRDAADVAAIIAGATRPFEPLGGGSKRGIGKAVAADVLDLGALAGIVSYEPAELVLTARAATPLAIIEGALGSRSQRLAFEQVELAAESHDRGASLGRSYRFAAHEQDSTELLLERPDAL